MRGFLGLGSNVGARRALLRTALTHLLRIPDLRVIACSRLYSSPALLDAGAPLEWNQPFLNLVIEIDTSLTPHELLQAVKAIEEQLGRQKRGHWAPREIDIDILAYCEDRVSDADLTIPHPHMAQRDFVLMPWRELAPKWRHPHSGHTIAELCKEMSTNTTAKPLPKIVGILNLTPDSFSDGGAHSAPDAALAACARLIDEGADSIDMGAESTRPNAQLLSAEEEWQRLQPVLADCIAQCHAHGVEMSLDTRHAATAEKALTLGVDWINDVSGFASPDMVSVLAASPCKAVLMHSLSVPANPEIVMDERVDALEALVVWMRDRIETLDKAGIAPQRLLLDPGIGFGKTPLQSLAILTRTNELRVLGIPLLIGHSRKSFLSLFTDSPAAERDGVTLAFSAMLAQANVEYLRVHAVGAHAAMLDRL